MEPAQPTQADVTRQLGFEFPIPPNSHVSIYGATVNFVTSMPLAEARKYVSETMVSIGFQAGDEVERAKGEFFTDYFVGERAVGVLVFQVSDRGATIQVGAPK